MQSNAQFKTQCYSDALELLALLYWYKSTRTDVTYCCAESYKADGNEKFNAQCYSDALDCYNSALDTLAFLVQKYIYCRLRYWYQKYSNAQCYSDALSRLLQQRA
jgi:hypothetical protein